MLFALTITIQVGYKCQEGRIVEFFVLNLHTVYYIQFQQSLKYFIFVSCFGIIKEKKMKKKIKLTTYDSKQH